MTDSRPDILLVEDNPGDARLFSDALAEIEPGPRLHRVCDGIEAMQFLRKESPFVDGPAPRIIVLDLNLPRKDGREVLKEIKADPVLAIIPVIVFSGSDAPMDICTCYALHANCYIVKPRDMKGLTRAVRSLVEFWLNLVTIPGECSGHSPGMGD